jgi:hypothetical protein
MRRLLDLAPEEALARYYLRRRLRWRLQKRRWRAKRRALALEAVGVIVLALRRKDRGGGAD